MPHAPFWDDAPRDLHMVGHWDGSLLAYLVNIKDHFCDSPSCYPENEVRHAYPKYPYPMMTYMFPNDIPNKTHSLNCYYMWGSPSHHEWSAILDDWVSPWPMTGS